MSENTKPETPQDAADRSEKQPEPGGRALHVFLAIIIGVALFGFLAGTRSESYKRLALSGYTGDERGEAGAPPAPSYAELMKTPFGSRESSRQDFERAARPDKDLFAEVDRSPEALSAALEDRAENRAFEGAPPTIPHVVRQTGAAECMACHGLGMEIDGKSASPISHEVYTNCTQCHVEERGAQPAPEFHPEDILLDNAFEGLASYGGPQPAYEGAPPPIPHPTRMRTECASCHGLNARPGLRTTHPWRSQCTQCHAPSAELDLRPEMELAPFWEAK